MSFGALEIQLNDAKNSSKSLATVISPTRRHSSELKPEFLDGAQPGFNGLPSPVLFVGQRPRRILEVKNADAILLHIANIVIHSTIFNRRKRVRKQTVSRVIMAERPGVPLAAPCPQEPAVGAKSDLSAPSDVFRSRDRSLKLVLTMYILYPRLL
jgi:hypothetical protein